MRVPRGPYGDANGLRHLLIPGERHGVECIVSNCVEVNHAIVWTCQWLISVEFHIIVGCPISKCAPVNSVEEIPQCCWVTDNEIYSFEHLQISPLTVTPVTVTPQLQ